MQRVMQLLNNTMKDYVDPSALAIVSPVLLFNILFLFFSFFFALAQYLSSEILVPYPESNPSSLQ